MKTNRYIMVDLLLLGLTIALMIVFNVAFYPGEHRLLSGKESVIGDPISRKALIDKYSGNPDSALASLNKVLSADTTDAKGYYVRAGINNGLGRTKDAISDYTKAVSLNPEFFQAYLDRGLLSLKEKQTLKALVDISSAIRISPLKSAAFLISRFFKSVFKGVMV